jgi:shikimate dehydrogenase
VAVWNRTRERADELARELDARAVASVEPADVLVNCTSVGLSAPAVGDGLERSASHDPALNQLGMTFDQVGEYSYVVDLVYRTGPTPLLAAAAAHGLRSLDGIEVLVAQGALSFEIWTGRHAPLDVMRRAARGEDGAT